MAAVWLIGPVGCARDARAPNAVYRTGPGSIVALLNDAIVAGHAPLVAA